MLHPTTTIRVIALACGFVAISGHAASGDLDRTFAPGVVMTLLGENSPVTAMGGLSDGRVVVTGVGRGNGGFFDTYEVHRYLADGRPDYALGERGTDPALNSDYEISDILTESGNKLLFAMKGPGGWLIRQNPDGSRDTSFGEGGFLSLGDEELDWENPSSPLLLGQAGDGKILLMGFSAYTGETMIRRLLADGAADTSFGINGMVRHSIIFGPSLAVQADGKVLVAGFLPAAGGVAVVRFLASGAVDTAFGTAGTALVSLAVIRMAVQSDGKIILAGKNGSSQQVSRLNANGVLDSTFGTGGHAPSPFSGPSIATKPMIAADGRVLVLGQHQTTNSTPVVHHHVLCLNSDGSLHLPYGSNGIALTGLQADSVDSYGSTSYATILTDGRLQVGAQHWNQSFFSFAMVRLKSDGTRDDTYGGGVLRLNSRDLAYPSFSSLGGLALQPDGGIVYSGSMTSFQASGYAEVRAFHSDGRANTSFGNGGTLQMTGPNDGQLYGSAILPKPDGRFVLGGRNTITWQWIHSQRLPNGTADPSFNSGLVSVTNIGTTSSTFLNAMQLDGSGRVVSFGHLRGAGSLQDFVLTRHQADGSLDTTFGMNGVVTASVGVNDSAACMVILPDGKILVGGSTRVSTASPTSSPAMARFLPNGNLDVSFGTGGIISSVGALNASVNGLALLPDGRFIAALGSFGSSGLNQRPSLLRFMPSGILDTSFGENGVAAGLPADDFHSGSLRDVQIQQDGRIVAVGDLRDPTSMSLHHDVLVLRYEADGFLDPSFGHLGKRLVPMSSGNSRGLKVTIQPDNQILVSASGTSGESTSTVNFQSIIRLESGPLLANLALEAPTDRSASGVRLRGTVNPNGFATTALFEYGPTTSYGQSIPVPFSDDAGTVTESVETLLSGLTGGTTYHYRLTATTAAGTRSTPDSTFSTFSSLETWRQANFGSSGNTGNAADTADFDLDGVPNLIEWACGLSPSLPSRLDTPVSVSGAVIEFTYTRDTTAIGAVYQVEWSDSLPGTSWSTAGVSETVLSLSGTIQTVKATLPAGSNGGRFVRLKVQGPL
ncbi:MAG: hypothetical protein IPK22_03310 [Verrucomicrobiaceae bacterium]|nr:hypothetical protein [Verrucomicrobiaceae bacterium]